MIVTIDTNVFVSSFLSTKGAPAEVIKRWEAADFDVATSPILLQELERVLKYKQVRKYFKRPLVTIGALFERLQSVAILIDASQTITIIEDDPDDNRVLECAEEARAAFIVSRDEHLLRLKDYKGIVILPPAPFLTFLDSERKREGSNEPASRPTL